MTFPTFEIPIKFCSNVYCLGRRELRVTTDSKSSYKLRFLVTLIVSEATSDPKDRILYEKGCQRVGTSLKSGNRDHRQDNNGTEGHTSRFRLMEVKLDGPRSFDFSALPIHVRLISIRRTFLRFNYLFAKCRPIRDDLSFLGEVLTTPISGQDRVGLLAEVLRGMLSGKT